MKTKLRVCFDIETDGPLHEATRMWIIVIQSLQSGDTWVFYENDLGWQKIFAHCELVVGHNIMGFDLPVLRKLFNYELPDEIAVHDTLVMSQVLDYKRFGDLGHSLDTWGKALGKFKQVHEDWSQFSEEMERRCLSDVDLNVMVYEALLQEVRYLKAKSPNISIHLKAEMACAKWHGLSELYGWPFDLEAAKILHAKMLDELSEIHQKLDDVLGMKVVAIDKLKGEVATKKPKYLKNGCYDAHTALYFGISPFSGVDEEYRLVVGEYCRVNFIKRNLNSVADVKDFLFRNGWVPTQWNYKKDNNGKKVPSSPKITEDSLVLLGGHGELYAEFSVTSSREAVLRTWIEECRNGRVHGSYFNIGTPSMRTRHSIICNIPSGEIGKDGKAISKYGPEIRRLFGCTPGWKIIGADSEGNQARGLAHYLKDPVFIDTLLNGDIHQYNADILTEILQTTFKMNYVVPRSSAKRILYAFLFGASGGKLWSYIFETIDEERGKKLKNKFIKAVPGFEVLKTKLETAFFGTSKYGPGYIPSISGNRIYVDSAHKLLVYLLQSLEKITCGLAVMLTMENLKKEGIPYRPLIMYHDEEQFEVPESYAERAAQIAAEAFREGPKLIGVNIMDGKAVIGNNWMETH
jgi:DNA polymerase-1